MTTPTNKPVPSNDPRDLLFNAEKVDQFINSSAETFSDRFGIQRLTLEGIHGEVRDQAEIVLSGLGYLPPVPYTSGLSMTSTRQTVSYTSGGIGATYAPLQSAIPFTTSGAFEAANFRLIQGVSGADLSAGGGALLVGNDPGVEPLDGTVSAALAALLGTGVRHYKRLISNVAADNRAIAMAASGKIYVPAGVSIRCNFLPDDDVRKFVGEGTILTRDQWGTEHTLSIALANSGPKLTGREVINQAIKALTPPGYTQTTIGVLGDSITDGAFGVIFSSPQPTDGSGNLNSTNYDHNASGGVNAWFRTFVDGVNLLAGSTSSHPRGIVHGFNAASSGKRLGDGWAYRNFDYGFFQNLAYGKTAPDVLLLTMGTNDVDQIFSKADFASYLDRVDAIVRKAWGYGCTVMFASITNWKGTAGIFYQALLAHIKTNYPTVEFFDLAKALQDLACSPFAGSFTANTQKDSAEGGGYDLLHPETIGHRLLGASLAAKVVPSKVQEVRSGMLWVPVQTASAIVYCDSLDEIQPQTLAVSDAWMAPETSWPFYTAPVGEKLCMRFFFWVDQPGIELRIVEPKAPTYGAGSAYANVYRGYLSDLSDSPATVPMASAGLTTFSGYKVTGVGVLGRGLNVIEIEYDRATMVFAPMLQFAPPAYETPIPPLSRLLTASEVCRANLSAGAPTLYELSFGGGGAGDELPDTNRGQTASALMSLSVRKCDVSAGVIGWWRPLLGTGIAVVAISGTQVAVAAVTNNAAGSALATLTGDFSGAWTVNFLQSTAGCKVVVIDSAGAAFTHNLAALQSGGGVGLINTASGGTRRITLNGGSLMLARTSAGISGGG